MIDGSGAKQSRVWSSQFCGGGLSRVLAKGGASISNEDSSTENHVGHQQQQNDHNGGTDDELDEVKKRNDRREYGSAPIKSPVDQNPYHQQADDADRKEDETKRRYDWRSATAKDGPDSEQEDDDEDAADREFGDRLELLVDGNESNGGEEQRPDDDKFDE
jgi:hypothetical protein